MDETVTLTIVQLVGIQPTGAGEHSLPATRHSALNVTEDNEIPIDLSELDSGTRSDPVSSSLTSCRHLGAEQKESDLYSRLVLMQI